MAADAPETVQAALTVKAAVKRKILVKKSEFVKPVPFRGIGFSQKKPEIFEVPKYLEDLRLLLKIHFIKLRSCLLYMPPD